MPTPPTQTFANHKRLVPGFHGAVLLALAANFVVQIILLIEAQTLATLTSTILGAGLLGLWFYARAFALTVQDRVIRLEMRLRLREVLPDDLKPRIADLSHGQLIPLRFASDDELPALVKKVLDEHLTNGTAIKQHIVNWQADHLRA